MLCFNLKLVNFNDEKIETSYLTDRQQKVDVVRADVVLSQVNDGAHEGLLTVMVGRHFTDGSGELSHLDFSFVVSLEAGEHHLALAGLEAVDNARNGTLVVQVGEEDQLLVDEVLEGCKFVR